MEDWSRWSRCSVACGGGLRFRFRERDPPHCEDPPAEQEPARTEESEPCHLGPCPVDCAVSEWTAWCACSVTCGPGVHSRRRYIVTPSLFGAPACGLPLVETEPCSLNDLWIPSPASADPFSSGVKDVSIQVCRLPFSTTTGSIVGK